MDFTQLFGSMGGMGILISLCVIVPCLAVAGFFSHQLRRLPIAT